MSINLLDKEEILDALQGMVRQYAYENEEENVDSEYSSATAEAMEVLAEAGRMEILDARGRYVIGRWIPAEER